MNSVGLGSADEARVFPLSTISLALLQKRIHYLAPGTARRRDGLNARPLPPCGFIARPMEFAMVQAT